MKQTHKLIPYGSGPTTAQGRSALADDLEPLFPHVCTELNIGSPDKQKRIETGSHHLVWKITTRSGQFALRASSRLGQKNRHLRESLWTEVAKLGVAPKYHGCVRVRRGEFDGWLEAFGWIDGRNLSPSTDHLELARLLAKLHASPITRSTKFAPHVSLTEFMRSNLASDMANLRGRRPLDRLCRSRTAEALDSLRTEPLRHSRMALVHNDLVDANVLRSRSGISLIDWDWAMITLPEVDLFCFLSPFVRSWRRRPRYVKAQTASEFIAEYLRLTSRIKRRKQVLEVSCWKPYNVLLANWLQRETSAPEHMARLSFYQKAFQEVEKMALVLDTFK